MMLKKLFYTLCLFILHQAAFAQQTTLTLRNQAGKKLQFKIATQKVEIVNGHLNISLTSADNNILQVNDLTENFLKDTLLKNSKVRMVFIQQTTNKTFLSSYEHKLRVQVSCKKVEKGEPVKIKITGRILLNKNEWYDVSAVIYDYIPEKKYLSNYKKSTQ